MKPNFALLFVTTVIVLAAACTRKTAIQKVVHKDALPKTFTYKSITDTSIQLFLDNHKSYQAYKAGVMEFYRKRNFEYAWFTRDGMASHIDLFINLMNGAEHPTELSEDSIITYYNTIREDTSTPRAQQHLQNLEYRLTVEFFEFADKEWSGSNEMLVKKLEWYIPKKKLKYENILDTLLKSDQNDLSLFAAPMYSQYDLLKKYLRKYKQIEEEQGDWLPIVADKKSYKYGDTSSVIAQIKKRLIITEDLEAGNTSPLYDSSLTKAVRTFQTRYGMLADGKVGPLVIRELNVPIHRRIEQIIINMERCRWVPFELKGDYFMINIPEFKLHAYEGSKNLWDMNVVVGKATNKTVIFNGNLQYIVLNPYWVVTPHIFAKEFVPKLRKNPGFLKSQDIELTRAGDPTKLVDPYSVNWNHPESHYRSYVARQRPGVNNSLGKVKFIFPNQYNIYLHDTPAKALFAETNRSFSHGCIRVENPEALTRFLLRDDPNWSVKNLEKAWNTGVEQYIPLKKKVPVFIAYFTSWVDKDGRLNFRNDLYGHDEKMARFLLEKPRI